MTSEGKEQDNSQKQKEDEVFSYHTFIFPFIWEENGLSLAKYIIEGDNKCRWEVDKLLDKAENVKEKQFTYSQFQYFTRPARELIFEEEAVKHFSFQLTDENKKFIIYKEKPYKLTLNAIRLNLVSENHIGIMIFECENHCYTKLSEIQTINQYGRRVLAPFVTPKLTCAELADWIEVAGYKENFLSHIADDKLNLYHVADFIKELISTKKNITSDKGKFRNENMEFFIEPLIDDRMYVCSLVKNDELISRIKKFSELKGEYAYLSNFETSKNLYKLINIDTNDATLQSKSKARVVLSKYYHSMFMTAGLRMVPYTQHPLIH
ncbi:hypothetical protein [Lactovum odontotermitis]